MFLSFCCQKISETGSYAELLAKRGDFSDFIVEQLQGTEEEVEEEEVKEVETLTKEGETLILRCGRPWNKVMERRNWRAKRSKQVEVG